MNKNREGAFSERKRGVEEEGMKQGHNLELLLFIVEEAEARSGMAARDLASRRSRGTGWNWTETAGSDGGPGSGARRRGSMEAELHSVAMARPLPAVASPEAG